ncbi:hypothetical protein, partial [Actinacidiphila yeochonensis]|uniref:hypothetical protein n=1 Tax=Actinacidiphila yeochonensis TaxID=89050 RepID=UPI001E353E70
APDSRPSTPTPGRICRLRLDYEIVMSAELGGFDGLQAALEELGLSAVRLVAPGPTGELCPRAS